MQNFELNPQRYEQYLTEPNDTRMLSLINRKKSD